MTWADKIQSMDINNPEQMADFVIQGLQAAIASGDSGTLSNIMMNIITPYNLVNSLDWAGIPCEI